MRRTTGILSVALAAGIGTAAQAASCDLPGNIAPLSAAQLQAQLGIDGAPPLPVYEVGTVSGIGPSEEVFALLQQTHSRMLQNGASIYSGDQIIQLSRALQPQLANAQSPLDSNGFEVRIGNCASVQVPENAELQIDRIVRVDGRYRIEYKVVEPQFLPDTTASLETTQQFGQASGQELPVFNPGALPPGATIVGGLVVVGGAVVGIVALADDDDDGGNQDSP